MKAKTTNFIFMAILFMAVGSITAFGLPDKGEKDGNTYRNFTVINNFENPTDVNFFRDPGGSGQTTGVIFQNDAGSYITYRVHETEIVNPHTGSTGSMKVGYVWNTEVDWFEPTVGGQQSHYIRLWSEPGNANVPGKRFLPGQALEVFVYGDGSENRFRLMVRDGVNQLEGTPWYTINWTGWKRFTWDYNDAANVFGWVNGDGVMTAGNPFYFDSFHITRNEAGTTTDGVLYVDDLRIVDPFDVNFVVEDAGGAAIDDAQIHLNGAMHPVGQYEFELFPGDYTYFVTKDGFVTTNGVFEIDDEDLTVEVTLATGADLEYAVNFTIVDLEGELITDAILTINGTPFAPGVYSFDATPGFYHFDVSAEGYYPQSGMVTVIDEPIFRVIELVEDLFIFNTITLSWHVAPTAENPEHRLEHYSVWITKDTGDGGKVFDPDSYEMIFEETLTAEIDAWNFQPRSVNISWHHSKDVRVAFRHHNVTGMDRLAIDNVKIVATRINDTPATFIDQDFNGGVADPIDPLWLPQGWFAVDLDGDGHNWFFGATGENGYMASRSNSAGKNTLTPDNWLVTKEVKLPEVAYYNVTFAIKDQYDSIIEDAIITFRGTTYQPGHYVFSVPNGTYEYNVSKGGHIGTTGNATVYGVDITVNVIIQQMLSAVTFNVNMQQKPGGFTPGEHTIYITGSFPGINWAVPGDLPDLQLLSATDNVFIFTKTLMLPTGTFAYKYFDGPSFGNGEWAGGTDRQVTVTGEMTVNDWFGHMGEPTSVEVIEETDIRVFPNPTRSNLNISSSSNINQVRLVDMLGQVVYSADVNGNSHQVSVNSLRTGIYFVQIFSDKGLTTRKVQVQK